MGGGSPLESNKKILLTTTYINSKKQMYDYWKSNTPNRKIFGLHFPRIEAFGLRFIKQNVPEIEILEYPTWKQYVKKLIEKKWDVVGYSFFLNETHEIIEMAKHAKKFGISELWAGNYGALTPEINQYFDKIFYGYSENQIAQHFGYSISNNQLIHPPICGYVSTPYGIKLNSFGYLFTGRGCPYNCSFCQTPSFCQKPSKIPIESIKKTIDYYKKIGISQVMILDENFGTYRTHSEKIIDYLHKNRMYWFADTRADYLAKRFPVWKDKHMAGALTAIESINQTTLESINKKEKINEIIQLVKQLITHNKMVTGFFMIGFEHETIESIKHDIKVIAKLQMDITQLCVLTPLPLTPLWDDIENKYGIFDKDWHHYNAKHLVWSHPSMTPKEMNKVLHWSFKTLYPRRRPIQTMNRFIMKYLTTDTMTSGMKYMIKQFIHHNTFNFTPEQKRFLENGLNKEQLVQNSILSKQQDIRKNKESTIN